MTWNDLKAAAKAHTPKILEMVLEMYVFFWITTWIALQLGMDVTAFTKNGGVPLFQWELLLFSAIGAAAMAALARPGKAKRELAELRAESELNRMRAHQTSLKITSAELEQIIEQGRMQDFESLLRNAAKYGLRVVQTSLLDAQATVPAIAAELAVPVDEVRAAAAAVKTGAGQAVNSHGEAIHDFDAVRDELMASRTLLSVNDISVRHDLTVADIRAYIKAHGIHPVRKASKDWTWRYDPFAAENEAVRSRTSGEWLYDADRIVAGMRG